jgi:hypothetical protein
VYNGSVDSFDALGEIGIPGVSPGYGSLPTPDFPSHPERPTTNPFSDAVSATIEAFITRGPLAKKLFQRYRAKSGEPMTLSRSDLKAADIFPMSITATPQFSRTIGTMGIYAVIDWQFPATARTPLTLNSITVHLDGVFIVCPAGEGHFQGKMYITDLYDFDLKGFHTPGNPRNIWAELKVVFAHFLASGAGFPVTSDPTAFEETVPPVDPLGGVW